MYAVIASGGKQEKVSTGQTVRVELLGVADGAEVDLTPVLVVDADALKRNIDAMATFARAHIYIHNR